MTPVSILRRHAATLIVLALCGGAQAAEPLTVADYQQHRRQLERPAASTPVDAAVIRRGRYVARTSGCNDCHTPGYPESGGATPESDWLTGSSVGFRGPWGVSYPSNLRLSAQRLTEEQWLVRARNPMPQARR